MVGKAIRHASYGTGGRAQQILAVAFTYLAISASIVPAVFFMGIKQAAAARSTAKNQPVKPPVIQPVKPMPSPAKLAAGIAAFGDRIAFPRIEDLAGGRSHFALHPLYRTPARLGSDRETRDNGYRTVFVTTAVHQGVCPDCGTSLEESALSCPSCHCLTHAKELESLAAQAQQATVRGDLAAARNFWVQSLALLPPDSVQYRSIKAHIDNLKTAPQGTGWKKGAAGIGPALLLLFTKGKLLLARPYQAQHLALDARLRRRILGALWMDLRDRHGLLDLHS